MIKAKGGAAHSHKIPLYCPHCSKITGTIDDLCLRQLGICAECRVMYVEDRYLPIIDLSKYAPRHGLFDGWSREKIEEALLAPEK